MQKVIKYELLSASSASELTKTVTSHMSKGWVPSGTVIAFGDNLLQAMVMFEDV
jgi:hypothetical protein